MRIEKFEQPAANVDSLVDEVEENLWAAFLAAVAFTLGSATLSSLRSLLDQGRVTEAVSSIEGIWSRVADEWSRGFALSADGASVAVSSALDTITSFDQTSGRVVSDIRANRIRIMQALQESQRDAALEAIRRSIANGDPNTVSARRLRESVGLTRRQVEAVNAYRQMLENLSSASLRRKLRDPKFDRQVSRAIRDSRPLAARDVDRMVEAYRRRYLEFRGRTIAQGEAVRAVHQGAEAMLSQSISTGILRSDQVTQTWNTREDARVRDSHASISRTSLPFGEPFLTSRGNFLRFPGDPSAPIEETANCRCVLSTAIT